MRSSGITVKEQTATVVVLEDTVKIIAVSVPGPQGLQGIQGEKGDKGDTGAKGDQGEIGPAGPQGEQGIQGLQGIQGIQGDRGEVGPAGLTWRNEWSATTDYVQDDAVYYNGASYFASTDPSVGDVPDSSPNWQPLALRGATGAQGIQGIQGETGATGATGAQGIQGVKGDTGAQGIQGIQGEKGDKGDKGDQGLQGIQGIKGDTGAQGVKGDQGIQGIQGVQGNPGIITSVNGKSASSITLTAADIGLGSVNNTSDVNKPVSTPTQNYIQSRLQNLITNGSGLLGNNTNFSAFTFDPTERFAGAGSFKATGNVTLFTDEYIPVDPSQYYSLTINAKSTTYVAGSQALFGVVPYDIDKNIMVPNTFAKVVGSTDTRLAADLNVGDTTVQLVDATGWSTNPAAYMRNMIWYKYTDSKGFTYPDYTYSATHSSTIADFNTNGLWATTGISGNTITLRSPWPASFGKVTAGTAVRNCLGGSQYKYIAAINVEIPNTWTQYTGWISGVDTNGLSRQNMFPNYCAYVRVAFLVNRNVTGSVTNVSGVSFAQQPLITQFTPVNGQLVNGQLSIPGQTFFDASYLYVCIGTNVWRRIPLTTY